MTYTLVLTEDRLQIYIKSLDSSIKLMGQQLAQATNGPLALKNLLPQLIIISQELDQLNKDIGQDSKDKPKDTSQ